MRTVTITRGGFAGTFLTAFAAAGLCLCSISSCTYKDDPEIIESIVEGHKNDGLIETDFEMVLGHVERGRMDVVLELSPKEPRGMYGIATAIMTPDGKLISESKGDILLVPGAARTLSLASEGVGQEGCEVRCSLTLPDGRTETTKRLSLKGAALSDITVFNYNPLPIETVEMNVGTTSTLLPDILPGCFTSDISVECGDNDVSVVADGYGINVTPHREGLSELYVKNGESTSTIRINAVSGTPSYTVSLPENVVILSGAEAMIVATLIPYASSVDGCSWSADHDGVISVTSYGQSALIRGLDEGSARVTFSSSLGTATTSVTVISSIPQQNVTSVTLPEALTLKAGEKVPVSATYEPADAVLGTISWSVSGNEKEIISLEASELSGSITGLHDGEAVVTVDIDGVRSSMTVKVSSDGQQPTPTPTEPTGDVKMPERIVMTCGAEGVVNAAFKDGRQIKECSWRTIPEGFVEVLQEDAATVFLKAMKEGQTELVFTSGTSVGVTRINIISSSTGPDEPGRMLDNITLPSTLAMTEGEEETLTAILSPSSYIIRNISWSISPENESPVSVSWAGTTAKVKAVKPGTATLTVNVDGKTASTAITVAAKPVELKSVDIETGMVDKLNVGESAVFSGSCNPGNYVPANVEWSASPEGIVGLAPDGMSVKLTASAPGTAEVKLTVDGKTATASVTVEKPVELQSVSIDVEEVKGLKVGESVDISGSFNPKEYNPKSIGWSASPEGIVSLVPDGTKVKVTGSKPGTVELTFTVDGMKASIPVTVKKPVELQTVSIDTGDIDKLKVGDDAMFTGVFTPENYVPANVKWSVSPEGIADLIPDGNSVKITGTAPGEAEITFTVDGKSASASITVEEPVKLESVDVSVYPAEKSLMVGQKIYLTGSCSPENYVPASISWSASPGGIVNIVPEEMEAVVTGIAPGNVEISFAVDGKTKTVRFSFEAAKPAYVPSLNGNEFYEGQNVVLSFTGNPVRDMETEVTLDGEAVLFYMGGINSREIKAGEHTYTVVQKFGDYVVDRKELPFTVYPSPAPVFTVTRGNETETFSSYICLRKGENVQIDVTSSEKENISIGSLTDCSGILTPTGQSFYCYRTGENSVKWSASRGEAHMEGAVPVVVYDVITAKVSAYTKSLSTGTCYVTLEITGNSVGEVTGYNVSLEPHYRIPLPNGKEIRYTGSRINEETLDLSFGTKHEWNVAGDAERCQNLLSAEGCDFSDVSTIYINLAVSGTLSDRYLVLEGYNGELIGVMTGNNSIIKEYYSKR